MFPAFNLIHLHDYYDFGSQISVLASRSQKDAS
jgi:hypothetical protein